MQQRPTWARIWALLLIGALAACAPLGDEPAPTIAAVITSTASASPPAFTSRDVRQAVAAGRYYTADSRVLAAQVDALLAEADGIDGQPTPLALVVPHAGYVYSGHVAAQAYRQIVGLVYEAIVILGVNHTDAAFRGISVWAEGGFETPLGLALVDAELAAGLIAADARIVFDRQVHLQEHSIEVQLPFLQRLYGEALRVVPIVIGEPSAENCQALAQALVQTLAGKQVLIIASADLSHYPAYDDAVRSDLAILQAIVSMDPLRVYAARDQMLAAGMRGLVTCSCGEGPVITAMRVAEAMGAGQALLLRYANSGDTPFGQRDQVVGYGAVMFWSGPDQRASAGSWAAPPALGAVAPLSAAQQQALLRLARETLQRYLTLGDAPIVRPTEPGLWQERAAFVTLEREGELRGCIGELVGQRPLYLAVQWAALSAAVADRRFAPVTADELAEISIEISALGPLQRVDDAQTIEVGVHGLLIVSGDRQGVLLPQVALDEEWDREAFLMAVCRKAGLPDDAWQDDNSELYAFTADVFAER